MAQSLLDFGNIAQLAQNQLQNTISMAHLGMQQDRLAMQQSRADTYADQLKLQQDQLKQTTMMNLHKLWNDPGIAMVPGAREEIGAKIGELAGAPSVNFNSMGVSRDTYNKYVQGLSSGDPKAFHEGMDGLITTLPIDDAKKVIETIQNSGINAEKYQNMILARKDHEAKVEEIQNKNALITYAKPLYQGASFDGDRILQGGDSPGLKKLRDAYEQAGPTAKGDLLSSKNPLVPDKKEFAHMLDGKLGQASLKYDAVAKDYGDQVNQDLDLLKQHEHGIALPEGINPSILQSRIEANTQLANYARSMAAYTSDPLDKTKYAAAKEAAKTMNTNRLNIEALEKNTNAQRMQLQTTLANFRMDEAQRKNSQASALAEAQRQYYALPTNKQNMQAASKISQAVKDSTGFDVTPEDIFKNPNKPLVSIDTGAKAASAGEVAYAEKFAGEMVKSDASMLEAARQAPDVYDRASRVMDMLNNKKVITGAGADFRLEFAKGMKLLGWSSSDAPENTETLFTELASGTLEAVKQSGLGTGTGFSNTDREYLEKAKGGRISLEKNSMMNIARIAQRVAKLTADKWNKRVQQLPDSALKGTGITRDPISIRQNQPQPSAAPSPGVTTPQTQAVPQMGPYKDQAKERRYQEWLKRQAQ